VFSCEILWATLSNCTIWVEGITDRIYLRKFLDVYFEDIKDQLKYLKQNDIITGQYYNDEMIGLEIPVKVELIVKNAPNAVKGNTSSGAKKIVTMENGLELQVPLFVKTGDIVSINTDTGEYTERRKS